MKRKLLYLLPLFLSVCMGCLKGKYVAPAAYPVGTFKGTYGYLHRSNDNIPFDTLEAKITLTLQNSDGTFKVTGDTTSLHAGSYGTYALSITDLVFTDKTYSATSPQVKKHLNGTYTYVYDGVNLKMLFNTSDTISRQYDLVKQ